MKVFAVFIAGLALGIGIGWFSHPGQEAASTTATPIEFSEAGQPEQSHTSESISLTAMVNYFLSRQDVDGLVAFWHSASLNEQNKRQVQSLINPHLTQLVEQQNWSLSQQWFRSLENAGMMDVYLYQLLAKMQLASRQYQTALETLYLAKSMTTSVEYQQSVQRNIEQYLDSLISNYAQNQVAFSPAQMAELLSYAQEQSPNYIPISLALSDLLKQEQKLQEALDVLAFLPFDEKYHPLLDDKRHQLEQLLEQNALAQTAIPLIKVGNQFLAQVSLADKQGYDETPLTLLLDTGTTYTSLKKEVVNQILSQGSSLSLKPEIVRVNTANGTTTARVLQADTLTLGHARLTDATVLEIDMGQNSRADGLLGMNFLGQYRFEIDQENGLLYLMPLD